MKHKVALGIIGGALGALGGYRIARWLIGITPSNYSPQHLPMAEYDGTLWTWYCSCGFHTAPSYILSTSKQHWLNHLSKGQENA